jgi:hypothetical protein
MPIRRHLLPICCTAAFILIAWLALSLPVAAAFLVDDAFVASEYLKFVLYAIGVGIGLSAVVMFPLSLFLERFTTQRKLLVVAVPVLFLFVSFVCLIVQFFLAGQFSGTIFSWAGFLFAFSLLFSFYWVVLHVGNVLLSFVRRFLRRTPS